MFDRLTNREIDVYAGDKLVKTIKRHVRRNEQFRPMHGTIEVQKREWVKVRAISSGPEYPRWQMIIEESKWLDPNFTIKK